MNTTGKILTLAKDHALWKLVLSMDQAYFPRPWRESEWNSIDFSRHKLWAWQDENRLVGYALFATNSGDETAHLLKILILPELRGGLHGRNFWKEITQNLKNIPFQQVYLEVEESNERARGFYSKLGFQVLHRVKSYYSDGQAAVMMQLTL
jgi:ribosomal protein S18 acetylase RimI-like enzyme